MKRAFPFAIAAGLAVLPTLAFAQDFFRPGYRDDRAYGYREDFRRGGFDAWGLERRAVSQRERIDQGIRSGRITRGEAQDLLRDQDRIWRRIQLAKADRFLSRGEIERLNDALNEQDRRIFRQGHDDDNNYNRYPRR